MTQPPLMTPTGAPATRADRILAVLAGATIGALLAGPATKLVAFGFL